MAITRIPGSESVGAGGAAMAKYQLDDGSTVEIADDLMAKKFPEVVNGPAPAPVVEEPIIPAPLPVGGAPAASLGADELPPVAPPATAPIVAPAPAAPAMATVTETQRTSKAIPKDVLKSQDAAVKAEIDAVGKRAEAESAIADAEAQAAQERALITKDFNEREIARQAEEQAKIAERQSKLDAAAAEYGDIKIDSGKFWADRSTGDKILAGIAVALGAFSQLKGASQDNPALTILKQSVDRDIDIQKANIDKGGKFLETQRGMFSDLLRKTGDERLARLKTHEMALQSMMSQYDALAAKSKSPLVQAKRAEDMAKIQEALVANKIAQSDQIISQTKTAPVEKAKPIEVPSTVATPLREAAAKIDVWGKLEDRINRLDSARLEEIAGPLDQLEQDLYKKMGWEIPEDAAQLRADMDIARFKFVKAMTGAGVNVEELRQYKDILPNLQNNPKTALAIIRGLKESAISDMSQIVQNEARLNPQYAPNIMNAYGRYIIPKDDPEKKRKFKESGK